MICPEYRLSSLGRAAAGAAIASALIAAHQIPTPTSSGITDLAERLCIRADGDHRFTWQRAQEVGFVPINPADFGGRLGAVGVEDDSLRGFTRTTNGVEFRVITAATWISSLDQGQTFYRWCSVSSSSGSRDRTVGELTRVLGVRSFRSDKVRLFAWIPRPDGTMEPVGRTTYMRSQKVLAREQGMRQVLVRSTGEGVSIGYGSPRDEATYRNFDWSGPDPVPRPE